jgi:hypothetical protein
MTVSKFEYTTFTLGEYPTIASKYRKVKEDLAQANKGWSKDKALVSMLTSVKSDLEANNTSELLDISDEHAEREYWIQRLANRAAVELLALGKVSPDLMFKITCLDPNDLVECIRKCTVLSSQLNHEVQAAERTVQTGDVVPIDQMENDS